MRAGPALAAERAADRGGAASRIAQRFEILKRQRRKAFIAYICAGDPDLDATERLVPALADSGADIIELGIPYSDPMADGPANQAACQRALASGTTVRGVLECVRRIRRATEVPLLFFTYVNPMLAYGLQGFARDARAAGVDGILPLDAPPDEDARVHGALRAAGLDTICLAAPTTPPVRRRMLARASRGFLYYVCRLGVTGERASLPSGLRAQVAALKLVSRCPVCIGFGISTPQQAAQAASVGDGVIVGSHLVRLIEAHGRKPDLIATVSARARALAAAVHGAS